MSANTWNFPCYQPHDDHSNRNAYGMAWSIGPGMSAFNPSIQPFTESITCIFSFLFRTGWSYGTVSGLIGYNGIIGIGYGGATAPGLGISCYQSGSDVVLLINAWNAPSGPVRYTLYVGDENGTGWMSADKWYQVGLSMNSSGYSLCVNGSASPYLTASVNNPGALALNYGDDKVWLHNYRTNTGLWWYQLQDGWSTLVHGPAMYRTTYMDFSDATIRNRIWDSDGNFKNPGADGSLWLGDTYGATKPQFYLLDGSGRYDNGTYNVDNTQTWFGHPGGDSTFNTAPGGLRKQYE